MQKYFLTILVLIGFIFQFSSCEVKYYTVLIKNESSKSVSYVYDGDSNTLSPGESKKYDEIKAYTQPPKDISVFGTMSVKMTSAGDIFTFIDIDEITLNVTNLLPFNVKLKADNYIDAGNGETEMEITTNANAKIYTTKPRFTAIPQQCAIEWKIKENTMDVTIK